MRPAAPAADPTDMAPLVPAALELRTAAAAIALVGGARAASLAASGDPADQRAVGLGLAAGFLGLWLVWGSRTVRTAIRVAIPVRPRWELRGPGVTMARALALHAAPACALALTAGALVQDRAPEAPAAAAGALAGAGLTALLAARRVARAERRLGRRLLREPRLGAPLGRRSLFLEPLAGAERPSGTPAVPWPSHRPAPRAQSSAIELDPANPAALHAVGVSPPWAAGPPGPGA